MTTIRTRPVPRKPRRWLAVAAGVLVLQSIGCGTTHSNRGGDPVLGSFNRPIVPTPSPTGPNIGGPMEGPGVYAPPGVSADQLRPSEFPTVQLGGTPVNGPLPGYTTAPYTPMTSGLGGAFGGEAMTRRLPGGVRGATLPPPTSQGAMPAMTGTPAMQPGNYPGGALTTPTNAPPRALPVYPGSMSSPMPTSGLPLTYQPAGQLQMPTMLPATGVQQAGYQTPAPALVRTNPGMTMAATPPMTLAVPPMSAEDGQQMLRANGMRWMRLEQIETGEWYFIASRGANPDGTTFPRFEARRPQAADAVRAVIQQVAAEMQAGR